MTRSLILPALAAALAAGCTSRYTPVPVRGTVTLDGKPIAGATVNFFNTSEGAEGRMAFATTADDGTYELSTMGDRDGALPGDYKVVIVKWVPVGGVKVPDFPNTPDGQMARENFLYKTFGTGPRYKTALPERYASPESTPLTFTVERAATADFALTSS